jgi:aryl-alcohol dehydrogenase-like predicted oxidoreductase
METRTLGATALTVSRLGLGLAALGRPGYINLGHAVDLQHRYDPEAMAHHAQAVLDAAWQAGVRYFDVARSYGRAESFLGQWLQRRRLPATHVTVGSKWGYTYTADWQVTAQQHEVKEHSLAVLQRQWHESQALLHPYLKLYQIHSATLESGVLDNTAVLTELARYKANGLAIGLTLSGAQQAVTLDRALGITVDGVRLFDCVQATWNLLEPSAGATLADAHEAGVGVIVKEALANGRLTPRNLDPHFAPKLALLTAQAQRRHTTVDALALAAVLAQPWADVVLSGAATIEQVQSHCTALAVHWDTEAAASLTNLAESPANYWQQRSQLAWN